MEDQSTGLEPKDLQQAYLDFKKVVDKYFSKEVYSEGVFSSTDMANAIEEMSTAGEKLARIQKENQNENTRDTTNSV